MQQPSQGNTLLLPLQDSVDAFDFGQQHDTTESASPHPTPLLPAARHSLNAVLSLDIFGIIFEQKRQAIEEKGQSLVMISVAVQKPSREDFHCCQ